MYLELLSFCVFKVFIWSCMDVSFSAKNINYKHLDDLNKILILLTFTIYMYFQGPF